MGGLHGTNLFASPGMLKVLCLFENKHVTSPEQNTNESFDFGKIVKAKTVDSEIRKHKNRLIPPKIISHLIEKKIIEFGFELQCPYCSRHSFYIPSDLKANIRCSWCHDNFDPPFDDPKMLVPSYRGIGPFGRKNRADGIITVLLTLRFFSLGLFTKTITPIIGIEFYKKKDEQINELDLTLYYKKFKSRLHSAELIFCECKTDNDFTKRDVERMENIGNIYPNSILVFATSKSVLSSKEKKLLIGIAKKFRKGLSTRPLNSILILTASELLNYSTGEEQYKDLIVPHLKFEDEIGHLCDVTTQYYLGLPPYREIFYKKIDSKLKEQKNSLNK